MVIFFKKKKPKRAGEEWSMQWLDVLHFRERRCSLSLDLWLIRLSKFFGARRKAAIRGETYAWAPVLGVFDKLREVGFFPYLGFILYLSSLLMFELNEAVRGRLIGPKSWD